MAPNPRSAAKSLYWFEEGLFQKSTEKTDHKVSKILRALWFAEVFFVRKCTTTVGRLDFLQCTQFTQFHYFVQHFTARENSFQLNASNKMFCFFRQKKNKRSFIKSNRNVLFFVCIAWYKNTRGTWREYPLVTSPQAIWKHGQSSVFHCLDVLYI